MVILSITSYSIYTNISIKDSLNIKQTNATPLTNKVIVVDDPELKDYRTEPYTHAIASVINEFKPEIFLIGATAIGRDLGPRVCARIHTGLTADCTKLDIGDFPMQRIYLLHKRFNFFMTLIIDFFNLRLLLFA